MAIFKAPEGALTETGVADLTDGRTFWVVNGSVIKPYKSQHMVNGAPYEYKSNTEEMSPFLDGKLQLPVVNIYRSGEDKIRTYKNDIFLSDHNLQGASHNDNYVFLIEADADKALVYFQKCWDENPVERQRKIDSDLSLDYILDSMDYDYGYDD